MAKYSRQAGKEVHKQMREKKGGRWKSRKQAIAVGLAKARRKGAKTPPKPKPVRVPHGKR